MKKNIIFTDLDGTLFNLEDNKVHISMKNKIAINEWTKNHYFSVATGRNIIDVVPYFNDETIVHNLPMVLSNGTIVYDFKTDKILYQDRFNKSVIDEAIEYVKSTDKSILILMSPRNNYVLDHLSTNEVPKYDFRFKLIKEELINYDEITGIGFLINPKDFDHVLEDVKNFTLIDETELIPSGHMFIELVNKGTSKATGIIKALNHVGINDYHLYAIGDFNNDIDMLKSARKSFAPDNARPEVKAIVDQVLCNHNDGAVAMMIDIVEKMIKS